MKNSVKIVLIVCLAFVLLGAIFCLQGDTEDGIATVAIGAGVGIVTLVIESFKREGR